ncbi:MAG: kelch repeat-containing protein, partial [Chloroflexota bacterium]
TSTASEPLAQPISTSVSEPEPVSTPLSTTNWVLIGGLGLLLVLTGLVAWFILNPGQSEPAAAAPFEPEPRGEDWFTSRPLPESLSGASAVSVGNDIYLTGGMQSDGNINSDLYVYNTIDRAWKNGTAKPDPFINSAAVAVDQLVWIIGGEDANGNETGTTQVYRPSDDAWLTATNLPKPITKGLALTDGSRLFHIGGRSDGGVIADVFAYDPITDSWSSLPPLPEGRSSAAGGIVNGIIYVIGGANAAGEATATCFEFALSGTNWETCAAMGNSRIDASSSVILNRIYILGGETGANFGELYNPESDIWEKINQPILEGLDNPSWTNVGAANVESKVYLFGGEFNGTMSADAFFYSPKVYKQFIPAATNDE